MYKLCIYCYIKIQGLAKERRMEEEIDIQQLIAFFIKNIFHFILSTVFCGFIGLTYAFTFNEPSYISRAELLVNQGVQMAVSIEGSQIDTSIQLINTYRNIIVADSTLNMVSEESKGRYSPAVLREAISVETHQDSQTFTIQAKMDTPVAAQTVVSTTLDVFEQQVKEAYKVNDPNIFILSPPTYNSAPLDLNYLLFAAIGGMLGFVLCGGILLLRELLNTKIQDSCFVDTLGLVNLGNISSMSEDNKEEMKLSNRLRIVNSNNDERLSGKYV